MGEDSIIEREIERRTKLNIFLEILILLIIAGGLFYLGYTQAYEAESERYEKERTERVNTPANQSQDSSIVEDYNNSEQSGKGPDYTGGGQG